MYLIQFKIVSSSRMEKYFQPSSIMPNLKQLTSVELEF